MTARYLALLVAASFALAGCSSGEPAAAPPPGPTAAASTPATATTSPAASPVATGQAAGDWCALVRKLGNQSGLMVGTHYISPLKETLDQLKAATDLYLANAAALDDPGLPPDVRAAQKVEGAYFQSLADHNYAANTPLPAGFTAALATVNAYQTSACGFVFDK
jgi:hypothetical protein